MCSNHSLWFCIKTHATYFLHSESLISGLVLRFTFTTSTPLKRKKLARAMVSRIRFVLSQLSWVIPQLFVCDTSIFNVNLNMTWSQSKRHTTTNNLIKLFPKSNGNIPCGFPKRLQKPYLPYCNSLILNRSNSIKVMLT